MEGGMRAFECKEFCDSTVIWFIRSNKSKHCRVKFLAKFMIE